MQEDFKILIVDDNKELAKNLSDILRVNNYNVTIVFDGKSAIKKCKEKDFQLAVLDIKLPDFDGLKLAEELSKISSVMEFIIITGYGSLESASEAVRLRKILAYETKPLDIDRFISLIRQIVERKLAVFEKERMEERFRLAAEVSTDLIYEWDIKSNILEWFGEFDEVLGFEHGEISRTIEGWVNLIHPYDQKKLSNSVELHRKSTEPIYEEYRVRRKDGSWRYWIDRGSPVLDEKGKPVKWIGGCEDITERKQAEEELRQSEGRFKRLFEGLGDAVYVTKIGGANKGRILEVNPAAIRQTGYTRNELLHMNIIKDLYISGSGEINTDDWDEKLHKGEIVTTSERKRRKDGTEFWTEVIVTPIEFKGEKASLSINHDITERKKAEEELKKLLAELERSNKELEQFAYVASHDLQEPLRTVSNYVQLLSERYKSKLDKNADDFIVFITDAVGRMQSLIKDLLTLSRVGTSRKEFKSIDLNIILEQVTNDLQTIITESKTEIKHDKLPAIVADDTQIEQLFRNLIENAIKFKSTNAPRIIIECDKKKHEWIFKVKDNGIGIDPQFSERVFVLFQQLHSRDKCPGTGIGLTICKKIVERHGGRIWVESKKGKGSAFCFSLGCRE